MPCARRHGACHSTSACCPQRPMFWRRCALPSVGRLRAEVHCLTNWGVVFPQEMTRQMWPLALKLGLRGSEAAWFKNGLLHHMYKGRGDRTECAAYRGILLTSSLSKCIHRAFRPKLAAHFNAAALEIQIGGRKGQSGSYAVHACRQVVCAAMCELEQVMLCSVCRYTVCLLRCCS